FRGLEGQPGRILWYTAIPLAVPTASGMSAAIKHPTIPSEPRHLVYVVGFGGYVKIGSTSNFWQRLVALQVSAPEKLVVYGAIVDVGPAVETELHARFSSLRLNGEWFAKKGALSKWIKGGCKYSDLPARDGFTTARAVHLAADIRAAKLPGNG